MSMNAGRFVIAATVAAGFWRCGRHFTKKGVLVEAAAFTEAQWARLKAEARLRISPAPEDEAEADASQTQARVARIAEVIRTLAAGDFQRDGKPRLEALNALLGEELGKIGGAERDAAWTGLRDSGFEAPKAQD